MRTPLAATLLVLTFATSGVALAATSGSSGGSSGTSSGGGASVSSGGGGASHASGGGTAGGHMGGAGGSGHAGFSGGRGYSAFSGRDIAHGGFRVLDTRAAPSVTSAKLAGTGRSPHNALDLGPKLGSAAKATLAMNDKRRVTPGPGHHPHHLRHGKSLVDVNCAQSIECRSPQELCADWVVTDIQGATSTSPLDCPQPRKLTLPPKL